MTAPPPREAEQPHPGMVPDPALRHVTEQTRTYPCSRCGASLIFDPARQGLRCPACGFEMPIDLTPVRLPKHDLGQVNAWLAQFAASPQPLSREVICQNCGGRTTFGGALTATRCPYCNTPIQRDDLKDAPTRIPADGVLPMRISQQEATRAIEAWINSRWFAPNSFRRYRTLGSFTSIYLTYYLYDIQATSAYRGARGVYYTVTVGSGEDQRQEIRTDWTRVWGTVHTQVADLPVLANDGLDERRIQALEPWPVEMAVPYQQVFLAGHLSRSYDLEPEAAYQKYGQPRVYDLIRSQVRHDIGGNEQRIDSIDTSYQVLDFAQVLMPVWLLTVTYKSRPFQVFINAMTGEVQGQRPYSAIKIVAAVVAVITVVILFYLLYRSG